MQMLYVVQPSGRRDVPVRQLADEPQFLGGVAVLTFHHSNRILHGAERARPVTAADGRCRELADIRKQHLFFLEHVLSEVAGERVETRSDAGQLRVARAVHLGQFGEIPLNDRHRRPDIPVVRRYDVIDQPIEPATASRPRRCRRAAPGRRSLARRRRDRPPRSGRHPPDPRRPPQQKSMPNRSNIAAVRKSAATISPTVIVVTRSLMDPPVNPKYVRASAGRYDAGHMQEKMDDVLRRSTLFRRLGTDDRQRLAAVATMKAFDKGATLFNEGDPSDLLYTVLAGRVKVFKTTPRGTDVILELFGPGDPVGAVAVYESRPYPATAVALEPTSCIVIPRQAFFALLETHPSMVRGLLVGLTHRLVELTNRLTELSGGRIEGRLARFFLKLAQDIGQPRADGIFIPLTLSRQELADMIGTTIETSIRIMSRWGKDDVVRTEKDGFLVVDRGALETVALT